MDKNQNTDTRFTEPQTDQSRYQVEVIKETTFTVDLVRDLGRKFRFESSNVIFEVVKDGIMSIGGMKMGPYTPEIGDLTFKEDKQHKIVLTYIETGNTNLVNVSLEIMIQQEG